MSPRDLLTALDAHHPGESLADDPALVDVARALENDAAARRLRERVERADRRIGAAMQAVDVPAGLAERLLAGLPAMECETKPVASDSAAADASADAVQIASRSGSGRRWRRRAFLAGGVAAIAGAVMLAIHFWPKPLEPWSADEVLDAAIALYTRDVRTAGRPLAERPGDLPPSDELVNLPQNTLWRRIEDALAGSDAVAYDIELFPGGSRGTLYAFSPLAEVTGLPDAPPQVPATPTTQGVCAAAWKHRGVIYVLVVEGGPREYKQFLRNRDATLAGNPSFEDRRMRIEGRALRG